MEKYYTPKEVMELFRISKSTLNRMRLRKELVPVYVGKQRRFSELSIKAYVENLMKAESLYDGVDSGKEEQNDKEITCRMDTVGKSVQTL